MSCRVVLSRVVLCCVVLCCVELSCVPLVSVAVVNSDCGPNTAIYIDEGLVDVVEPYEVQYR